MCIFVWLIPGFLPGDFLSVLFPAHATIYFRLVVELNLYQPGVVNASVPFPSEWNELSLKELHHVAKTIISDFKNPYDANAFLFLKLLASRVNGKVKLLNNKKLTNIENLLDAEQVVIDGLPAMEFIFKGNTLTKQPYPTLNIRCGFLKHRLIKYQGPDDNFNTLTCGEFEDAEIFFNQFKYEPTQQSLAHLASILYRPAAASYLKLDVKTGQYVEYDSEKPLRFFKKVPAWKLYAIFLWYAGCRDQLPKLFPNCFGGTMPDENNGEIDFMIFTKCIHAGAGAKNGTRNDIRRTKLKEFFMEMELEKLAAIETQKQHDAAK